MFQLTPFGSNSILTDDIDAMPTILTDEGLKRTPSTATQQRIAKVQHTYKKAIPSYMIKLEASDKKSDTWSLLPLVKKLKRSYIPSKSKPNTYWVKSGFSPQDSLYSWQDFYSMKAKRNKKVASFKEIYNQIVTSNLPEEFVLVALHYQPEETSCPTGGVYSDQVLMIQLLNQYLPTNLNIVIKEHKTQFYSHVESASGRNLLFYERILQISKRIKFVPVDYDPFKLIDQAQVVVTISGTIGWESAVRGTPTIVFGRAWYEGMPRVLKVKTKHELINALLKLSELKNKDLRTEIMNFHANLEDNFVHAKHYKAYLNNDDITMEDSIINITDGLENFLDLKNNSV